MVLIIILVATPMPLTGQEMAITWAMYMSARMPIVLEAQKFYAKQTLQQHKIFKI